MFSQKQNEVTMFYCKVTEMFGSWVKFTLTKNFLSIGKEEANVIRHADDNKYFEGLF